jgi:hypothetical protein
MPLFSAAFKGEPVLAVFRPSLVIINNQGGLFSVTSIDWFLASKDQESV